MEALSKAEQQVVALHHQHKTERDKLANKKADAARYLAAIAYSASHADMKAGYDAGRSWALSHTRTLEQIETIARPAVSGASDGELVAAHDMMDAIEVPHRPNYRIGFRQAAADVLAAVNATPASQAADAKSEQPAPADAKPADASPAAEAPAAK